MGLADKVAAEKVSVAAGTAAACAAAHDHNEAVSGCVRLQHLPSDRVHVGEIDGQLIQWEEPATVKQL